MFEASADFPMPELRRALPMNSKRITTIALSNRR